MRCRGRRCHRGWQQRDELADGARSHTLDGSDRRGLARGGKRTLARGAQGRLVAARAGGKQQEALLRGRTVLCQNHCAAQQRHRRARRRARRPLAQPRHRHRGCRAVAVAAVGNIAQARVRLRHTAADARDLVSCGHAKGCGGHVEQRS